MRILIINPNSTASMTRKIEAAAKSIAALGTQITAMNPLTGPPAIQGPEDGEAALPGLYALFEKEIIEKRAHDMVIIACFDDTGLLNLKRRSVTPVLGIGEAAFHAAMLISERFSVVTTLGVSVPIIEDNIYRYGFASRCSRVRASEIPVLDLEDAEDSVIETLASEIELAIEQDDCGAIVLGCAGMADLSTTLSSRFGIPVIDGVAAAVSLCEALSRSGVSPTKNLQEAG